MNNEEDFDEEEDLVRQAEERAQDVDEEEELENRAIAKAEEGARIGPRSTHKHEWKFMGHNGVNGKISIYWCSVCGTIKEVFHEGDTPDNIVAPRMLKDS